MKKLLYAPFCVLFCLLFFACGGISLEKQLQLAVALTNKTTPVMVTR
ncbi:MAG: hypothetical protein LBN18_05210 [Dysgonamonadaceae bacterium]|nr:hypothetical protein [Dysgonamonadaceae bacterium]